MTSWSKCESCQGRGNRSRRIRKKAHLLYRKKLEQFKKLNSEGLTPIPPKGHLEKCSNCSGLGIIPSLKPPISDTVNYPKVAIIGGGIGGVALAVACLHRGIPFTLYERDTGFDTRPQGYGLTLQQASKAIEGFGISSLKEGVVSNRHVVHTTEGKVIGEWGMRKWMPLDSEKSPKKTNIHISRQSLRYALIEQLGGSDIIKWGHQLIGIKETKNKHVNLTFKVNGLVHNSKADLVIGADGIRSSVRNLLIGEKKSPLRYLGCIVILGICPLSALDGINSELLDSATVFQTANGNERIYIMPFSSDSVMWQLSFPISEEEAKAFNKKGPKALKGEALKRTQWHSPIPEIVKATIEDQISGYPVYDRALLKPELLEQISQCTLIGDAAHPMSPFKGQGANQALLDALALGKGIARGCRPSSNWEKTGIRKSVLTEFESEMLERSASKVIESANAAKFLHSEIVLHKSNQPRGRNLNKKDK